MHCLRQPEFFNTGTAVPDNPRKNRHRGGPRFYGIKALRVEPHEALCSTGDPCASDERTDGNPPLGSWEPACIGGSPGTRTEDGWPKKGQHTTNHQQHWGSKLRPLQGQPKGSTVSFKVKGKCQKVHIILESKKKYCTRCFSVFSDLRLLYTSGLSPVEFLCSKEVITAHRGIHAPDSITGWSGLMKAV